MSASRRAPFGFTLLELLVAMAVLILLITMLLTLTNEACRLWHQTENRIGASREARAALGIMAADIRNAEADFSLDGTPAFLVDPVTLLPSDAQTDTNIANSIFFLTSPPVQTQADAARSGLCQIGYFLAYAAPPLSTSKSWNLYRFFRDSETTFSNLAEGSLFRSDFSKDIKEGLLARNVAGLRIAAYVTNEAGNLTPYRTNGPRPVLLTLTLTILDHETARRLTNKSQWLDESPLIQHSLQTFHTRLAIPP